MLFVMNYKKFCLGWMSSVVIRNEEEVLALQAGNVLLMGHGASAPAALAVTYCPTPEYPILANNKKYPQPLNLMLFMNGTVGTRW